MRKVLRLSIIGVLVGTFVGLWLSIFFSGLATAGSFYASLPTSNFTWKMMVTSALLWALLGAWMSLAQLIFDYVNSLLAATILHAVTLYLPLVAVAWHEHWLSSTSFFAFNLIFVLIYLLIWVSIYHHTKHQLQILNKELHWATLALN